jgi:hypothetical protein
MRTLAAGLVVAILVAGTLLPALAQQSEAITPGRAIGPIELGMPLDRARQIMSGWGTVEDYDGPLGHGVCNPERGVGVCAFDRWARLNVNTADRVAFVLTDDARFTTVPGGHKVGGALLDILKTFGLYSSGAETELLWDSQGFSVDVRVSQVGLIVGFIGVYSPRAAANAPGLGAR